MDKSSTDSIKRVNLDDLPHTTGVYIFQGSGTLPLYIGKSVDIRSRVLSHFRAPDESRLIAQTRRIDYIETAGEIGALLLESQMIKACSPLFNIRLRRSRSLCSLQLSQKEHGIVPEVVHSKDVALGRESNLFGLFNSRRAALDKLRGLAVKHQLCLAILGLETHSKRGCFGLQLKTCRGACIGQEDKSEHDARLAAALTELKVHIWPYDGPVYLVERNGNWVQKHLIEDWRYGGTWCSRIQALSPQTQAGFDVDIYKILVKPLFLQKAEFELCHA
jgi:excinuclease Cho